MNNVQYPIDLRRNLTEKRLPADCQGWTHIRMVVYDLQPEGHNYIHDIVEGPQKTIIRHFNSYREYWLSDTSKSVKLEEIPTPQDSDQLPWLDTTGIMRL